MGVKLAFYKGTRAENPHALPFDRLVCWWRKSRGRFSHVELVLREQAGGLAWCLSSSMRDGGVRCKWIDLTSGRWVIVDVPGLDEEAGEKWFTKHAGSPYDYPGILGYVVPFVKQWRRWWYCSEAVADAIRRPDGSNISPSALFAWAQASPGARVYETVNP